MILMVVAVTCGLVASYMTSRLLADRGREEEKVSVLVASKVLSQGDILKVPEDLFVQKQFAKGDEPKLAIVDAKELKGRILKRSLRAGDFITAEDMLDSKSDGIAWNLPVGHQALGIRVSAEQNASGWASLPNSRINIISTVRRSSDRDSYSKILLENVLVLAADTQSRVTENGNAMPANVVTVALKPEDVLKVELAKTMGTISLALRKFNDTSLSGVTQVNAEGLNTGSTNAPTEEPNGESSVPVAVPPVVKVEPKPAPVATPKDGSKFATHTLEIIQGGKVEHHEFRREIPAEPVVATPAPKKEEKTPADGN